MKRICVAQGAGSSSDPGAKTSPDCTESERSSELHNIGTRERERAQGRTSQLVQASPLLSAQELLQLPPAEHAPALPCPIPTT